jgi:nucleoside-diphosphate-sugar epimerase
MKILVTGGGGYIGCRLVPELLRNKNSVTVLDRFFFGQDMLEEYKNLGELTLIREDTRWFDGSLLRGFDAVVDMAALSNDPTGALNPWKTYEINFLGRSRVARLAKEAGVSRYLLFSSCSVYGFQDGILNEESPTIPLTDYARANILAEKDNLSINDADFCVTAARFSTIYGLSKRMRFDLAVNGMVLGALRNGKIPVMRDGSQWRPFLYIGDAARAVVRILEADKTKVNGQIFNIGSDRQNYQVRALADLVAGALSNRPTVEWYGDPDKRSYRVSFGKAQNTLGFETRATPDIAAKEIEAALLKGEIAESPKTTTLTWYKHLISNPEASKEVELRGTVL